MNPKNAWLVIAFLLGAGFGVAGTLVITKKPTTPTTSSTPRSTGKVSSGSEVQNISEVQQLMMQSEVQANAHTKDLIRRAALRRALRDRGVTIKEIDQLEAKRLEREGF